MSSHGELTSLLDKGDGRDTLQISSSFDSKSRWLQSLAQPSEQSPWYTVSPMTQHVIRESASQDTVIRRSRSRSFNDYLDERYHPPPAFKPGTMLLPPRQSGRRSPIPPPSPTPVDISVEPETKELEKEAGNSIWVCVMYGMINATIVLPVLMSFGSIIYRDAAFQPYMPVLIKLTLVSGVVHQICFSTLSSLPFAIGQVQDAGLIFLSSMAKDIVDYCTARGYDSETILATSTIGLATCTATLGLGLILIGKLKLAGFVQMLPTCVVGGYLAFIGWFCGMAGIGIMTGSSDLTFLDIWENLGFVLPGVLGGLFIYYSVRTFRHVAVLPMCIIILLILFYMGLGVTGTSVEEATATGWIRQSEPAPVWYHTWDFLKLDKVVWSALPQLVLTELSMIFVVALSSSLDVAAIELELNEPLQYNQELTMVGISNLVSGLTGGYTGSYIFSQSIFSLRAGIRSRLAGYVLALCQIVVIVTPFPILAYVPNFFYGSLLSMICIDLVYEWLWDIRKKITVAEYVVVLSTFALIQILGVEYGILAGVAIYVACRECGINMGEAKMATLESEEGDARSEDEETEDLAQSYAMPAGGYTSIEVQAPVPVV